MHSFLLLDQFDLQDALSMRTKNLVQYYKSQKQFYYLTFIITSNTNSYIMNVVNVQISSFDDFNKICRSCLCHEIEMLPLQEFAELFTCHTSITVCYLNVHTAEHVLDLIFIL